MKSRKGACKQLPFRVKSSTYLSVIQYALHICFILINGMKRLALIRSYHEILYIVYKQTKIKENGFEYIFCSCSKSKSNKMKITFVNCSSRSSRNEPKFSKNMEFIELHNLIHLYVDFNKTLAHVLV